MPHTPHIEVAFENPTNEGVLRYLRGSESLSTARDLAAISPESVQDPYMRLGTHPDLVSRLWDEVTTALPVRCSWIVYGTPVLVRPDTGIIFGFARGTHTYALRLPPKYKAELAAAALRQAEKHADEFALRGRERDRYLRAQAGDVHEYSDGTTFDLSTVGEEWAFGRWLKAETQWCLAAYEHAT